MRNVSYAFVHFLKKTKKGGKLVEPRGFLSREILSQKVVMEKPNERVVLIPFRANNIFATVAETFWVIAGKDDMAFLSYYLPRAIEFSDDGKVWRAAYGPRIRSWAGRVDQVKEVLKVLREKDTKRAVMSIFDPLSDYSSSSKDIPCNNWIQFLERNGKLHMNIALRANDLFWGFSGINSFEWSVLQELVAFELGKKIGNLTFFVGSLHYYERHFHLVDDIINNFEKSVYDFGIMSVPLKTDFNSLDSTLKQWFLYEKRIRRGEDVLPEISQIKDPFFCESLKMMMVYSKYKREKNLDEILAIIEIMPESDLRASVIEYMVRKFGIGLLKKLKLTPREVEFFSFFYRRLL